MERYKRTTGVLRVHRGILAGIIVKFKRVVGGFDMIVDRVILDRRFRKHR